MKKYLVILAGVLLISGVVLAEEKIEEKKAAWDFSGTKVEYTETIYGSETDPVLFTDDGEENIDMILKVSKELGGVDVSVEYDTDDADGKDDEVSLLLNKKWEKIEAQAALGINVKEGLSISELEDSDSYIKYSPSKAISVTFLPFDLDLGMGDELESTGHTAVGGIQLDYTASDALGVYFGLGGEKLVEDTNYLLKAGLAYEKDAISLSADISFETEEDAADIPMAASIMVGYEAGNLALNAEVLIVDNKSDTGFGAYLKGQVSDIAKVGEFGVSPYAELTYVGEDLVYEDSETPMADSLIKVAFGSDFTYNVLVLTPEVTYDDMSEETALTFTAAVEF